MKVFSESRSRIGIDLGSSQVRIFTQGRTVLQENTVLAADKTNREAVCFGSQALVRYHSDTSRYRLEWPVKNGIITDYYTTRDMLRYFMDKALKRAISSPVVVISRPSTVSSVVRHALAEATVHAGAQHVLLITSAAAAALGAGMRPNRDDVRLSVVMGRDVTDVGLFACGGTVAEGSIPFGGHSIDEGIRLYMMDRYRLILGNGEAENLKMGMAVPAGAEDVVMTVRGRRATDGVEYVVELSAEELFAMIRELLSPAVRLLKRIIRQANPEMAEDILQSGILFSGGMAKLSGLSDWLSAELGIAVQVPDDPDLVVAEGCAEAAEHHKQYPDLLSGAFHEI